MSGACAEHGARVVRSCAEASSASEGERCEGFVACTKPCGDDVICTGGVLHFVHDAYECEDAGVPDGSLALDDACAPRAPAGARGCHTSGDCISTLFEACFAPDVSPDAGLAPSGVVHCGPGAAACPTHTRCEAGAGDDGRGCLREPCVTDRDCGCGSACVGGHCFDELGRCAPVAAPIE